METVFCFGKILIFGYWQLKQAIVVGFHGFKRIGLWGLILKRDVAFIDALLAHLELLPNFHYENPAVFHLILWQKSSSVSPHMHHSTQSTILTKLSLWEYDKKMPHFHNKNTTEFHVWCTMVHWQGFVPMYTARISMFILRRAEANQSIKHIDTCCLHGRNQCH